MNQQSLRPLADALPEATEEMTLGEAKILHALGLVIMRLDDIIRPSIITNTSDIQEVCWFCPISICYYLWFVPIYSTLCEEQSGQ